jgi:hypothetical protein
MSRKGADTALVVILRECNDRRIAVRDNDPSVAALPQDDGEKAASALVRAIRGHHRLGVRTG